MLDEDMDKAGWAALIFILAGLAPSWFNIDQKTITAADLLDILLKNHEIKKR